MSEEYINDFIIKHLEDFDEDEFDKVIKENLD